MSVFQESKLKWHNTIKFIRSVLGEMRQPLWLGTIIWFSVGFGARVTLIFIPGLTLLDLLKSTSISGDVKSFMISIAANILLMLIGGWFIFTVLVKPNSTNSIFPDVKTRQSFVESLKMVVNYNFALTCASFVIEGRRVLLNSSDPSHIAGWYIAADIITAIAWLVIQINKWTNAHSKKDPENWEMAELIMQGRALAKLQERLTLLEQKELGELLYQTHELATTSLQSVTRTVWLSFILAGIIEIVREIGVRLIGTILK